MFINLSIHTGRAGIWLLYNSDADDFTFARPVSIDLNKPKTLHLKISKSPMTKTPTWPASVGDSIASYPRVALGDPEDGEEDETARRAAAGLGADGGPRPVADVVRVMHRARHL